MTEIRVETIEMERRCPLGTRRTREGGQALVCWQLRGGRVATASGDQQNDGALKGARLQFAIDNSEL